MEPITTITSKTVVFAQANIDTDQIIPARYLKLTDKHGLGQYVFADWRYHADGSPNPEFPLNREQSRGAQILVAGDNFGCGSSREHAPWALMDAGIRAVISTQIADIFRGNAIRNGLLPVIVDQPMHEWLLAHEGAVATIDLRTLTLKVEGGPSARFPFDPFAAKCLIEGMDEMDFLLSQQQAINAYEAQHS
ncbi:MAG: 3-isopropylmalate dehydratase small subunit [Anaerolineae bacterium]|nr:3-isopropylmalate dehydratase small subunit [Phycisphaerae bacterium]